jgi:hypothetical protein
MEEKRPEENEHQDTDHTADFLELIFAAILVAAIALILYAGSGCAIRKGSHRRFEWRIIWDDQKTESDSVGYRRKKDTAHIPR